MLLSFLFHIFIALLLLLSIIVTLRNYNSSKHDEARMLRFIINIIFQDII